MCRQSVSQSVSQLAYSDQKLILLSVICWRLLSCGGGEKSEAIEWTFGTKWRLDMPQAGLEVTSYYKKVVLRVGGEKKNSFLASYCLHLFVSCCLVLFPSLLWSVFLLERRWGLSYELFEEAFWENWRRWRKKTFLCVIKRNWTEREAMESKSFWSLFASDKNCVHSAHFVLD